ncbi:hypothetical protein ACOCGN_001719 [Vibrio cholerae]
MSTQIKNGNAAIKSSKSLEREANFRILCELTSLKDFTESSEQLARLALEGGGSGSCAAAQLLLSMHNSKEFQLAVTDLYNLSNFEDVVHFLRGRKLYGVAPENVLIDGYKRMRAIAEKWNHLSKYPLTLGQA